MSNTEQGKSDAKRTINWAVIGASGFVGSGIVAVLEGLEPQRTISIKAPRLEIAKVSDMREDPEVLGRNGEVRRAITQLVPQLEGIDVVVNAAGIAAPDASNLASLYGANSVLPYVIAEAAKEACISRFIHISSAAVQGNRETLDESPTVEPLTVYSRSKAAGEKILTLWNEAQSNERKQLEVVIVRATSVQGAGRQTTKTLKKLARSPLASVARPGNQQSVVSSLEGLSNFVVRVGQSRKVKPPILLQPWEGASVIDVMRLAGEGRIPMMLPRLLARMGVKFLRTLGWLHPRFKGLARRLEVMWFGQRQIAGWSIESGLAPRINKPTDALRRALSS